MPVREREGRKEGQKGKEDHTSTVGKGLSTPGINWVCEMTGVTHESCEIDLVGPEQH